VVHLHVHSYYSFLDGGSSPAELAQAAARAEMPALALTDHDALYGVIEFYDARQTAGLQPIIGMELAVEAGEGPPRCSGVSLLSPGPWPRRLSWPTAAAWRCRSVAPSCPRSICRRGELPAMSCATRRGPALRSAAEWIEPL
jgi:hypothetical protein